MSAPFTPEAVAVLTSFVKEKRPLEPALNRLALPIEQRLKQLRTTRQLAEFEAGELVGLVRSARPEPPQVGAGRALVPSPVELTSTRAHRDFAARHTFVLEVTGDGSLLGYWPSNSDDLKAVDDPSWPTNGLKFDPPDEYWQLRFVDEHNRPGVLGLYTSFFLTQDEEVDLDIRGGLQPLLDDRIDRLRPILARIREDIEREFDETLPQALDEALKRKREELATRERLTASVSFPQAWVLPTPSLEPRSDSLGGPSSEITIPVTSRLDRTSFDRLQQTIRIWANGLVRYERSFARLSEDQISDLLAATLNATLPNAQREVFSRGGKTDIFVKADVIEEGRGPEKVFIVESKWAKSESVVKSALDPQLFGYLAADDTAAVLLLLLGQKDRLAARNRYLSALRAVTGFKRETESAVEGWPILEYTHESRKVSICVATVHLYRPLVPRRARPRSTE